MNTNDNAHEKTGELSDSEEKICIIATAIAGVIGFIGGMIYIALGTSLRGPAYFDAVCFLSTFTGGGCAIAGFLITEHIFKKRRSQ